MSTLNAPPPPLPDQSASTVTTTSDAPRGDQKTMDVLAAGNELATRLIDERTRLAREQLELLAAAAVAKKAEEIRCEEVRKAEEARREEERVTTAKLSVETMALNLNAGMTLLKYAVGTAFIAGVAAYFLTTDDKASKNEKESEQ